MIDSLKLGIPWFLLLTISIGFIYSLRAEDSDDCGKSQKSANVHIGFLLCYLDGNVQRSSRGCFS